MGYPEGAGDICMSFPGGYAADGLPRCTPRALACFRPSLVRALISSRSNSASPPRTVRIHSRCQVDASEKISGELVVTCCDSSKVLEFVEEAFDEVALAIEGEIARQWKRAAGVKE